MDGRTKLVGRGSGRGSCPADRQAASWWSHLATRSQPEMMGPSLLQHCPVALLPPKGLWEIP